MSFSVKNGKIGGNLPLWLFYGIFVSKEFSNIVHLDPLIPRMILIFLKAHLLLDFVLCNRIQELVQYRVIANKFGVLEENFQ